MNLSEIGRYWHLIEAAKAGKVIEETWCGGWLTAKSTNFDRPPEFYRIKPEPRLRPWKPEEVPLDAWFRDKDISEVWFKAVAKNTSGVFFTAGGTSETHLNEWSNLLRNR